MTSVTITTTTLGEAITWINSFDAWMWVGVLKDKSSSPGDTFSEIVRVGRYTRSVELTIDVEDDTPFDALSTEIVDFYVDFHGYLYVLVAGEDTSVAQMDVMKFQPTGLLIFSAYDEGITTIPLLATRIEVDINGDICIMTSADEADGPNYPMDMTVISQTTV